jgi:hypothetical protein
MTIETYAAPTVTREIEPRRVTVSLTDFKLEDVAEFLREYGYEVNGEFSRRLLESARNQRARRRIGGDDDDPDYVEGLLIEDEQLARVKTLALCGQRESAREYVLQIVGDFIGRPL